MIRLIRAVNWPMICFYLFWLAVVAWLIYFGIYFVGPFTFRMIHGE
jgi:hypothetical protein